MKKTTCVNCNQKEWVDAPSPNDYVQGECSFCGYKMSYNGRILCNGLSHLEVEEKKQKIAKEKSE